MDRLPFKQLWAVDFEFTAPSGERPTVICMVARELRSGETIRLWHDELGSRPPFAIEPSALFIGYSVTAELSCFRVLGWPMPARILDPFIEFRKLTCGILNPGNTGLLTALAYHNIASVDESVKKHWQNIAIRGAPFTNEERAGLMGYCETDVLALDKLLPAMLPKIDLPRALLRGRYMAAASAMTHAGGTARSSSFQPTSGTLGRHQRRSDPGDGRQLWGVRRAVIQSYTVGELASATRHSMAPT